MSARHDEHAMHARPAGPFNRVEEILNRYNIRVAFGPSAHTGRPVIRLIDGSTGQLSQCIPAGAGQALAQLASPQVASASAR